MLRAQSKATRLSCFRLTLLLTLVLAMAGAPLPAATVPDLYVAQVPAAALSGPALDEAFALALDQVLVKVTGQRGIAADPARRRAVGPAAALVRQYQPVPGGQVRVSFDPAALRGRLDAANLPVWADDRPLTQVIVAAAAAPSAEPPSPAGPAGLDPAQAFGQLFEATAASRGIPVRLTMAPGAEPEAGTAPLLTASPMPASGPAMRRWTLDWDGDRSEWQGDAADGAHGLADRLAARYATTGSSARVLRLRITGVDSFDAYGRLQAYLRSAGLIRHAELKAITDGQLVYEVDVRGDVAQLNDAFALGGVLAPAGDPVASAPASAPSSDLIYRLVAGS